MTVLVWVLLIGLLYLAFGVLSLSLGLRHRDKPLTIDEELVWWLPDLITGELRFRKMPLGLETIIASVLLILTLGTSLWLFWPML